MEDLSKSGDRPATGLEITKDMIYAGRLGISSELLSWDDASEDEKNAAVKAAFVGMLLASRDEVLTRIGSRLSSGHCV
jgi:hypothetical protein